MGDLGFWALAHEDPQHLAIVDPSGREFTSKQLLDRTNQVVHAFRQFGLQPGDEVATLLPNGVEMFEL
jgi:long-chain acyl-CoA synthetase